MAKARMIWRKEGREGGQEEEKEEKVRNKRSKRGRDDHRFFPSSKRSSLPRLFEMLQKITGSGMKGCTVGGQKRRREER